MDDKWLSLPKNQWNLVIHEVTDTSATLWVGTLAHHQRKPQKVSIIITRNDGAEVTTLIVDKTHWKRPFKGITSQRFYHVETVEGLESGQRYWVEVSEYIVNDITNEEESIKLEYGSFWTLPSSVNSIDKGFTVALGSCFYEPYDGGQASTSYEALMAAEAPPARPHITFLTGDQVYLDIGVDSLSPIPKEVRDRVADDYATQWKAMRGILSHGGTWCLADDHEYWNNYPFIEGWSPFIQALRIPSVYKAWKTTARDGLNNVQRVQPVRIFSIGSDITFCIVDLRSFRSKTRILPDKHIKAICNWISTLTCPGVLVLSQPIIEPEGSKSDRNFVSYSKDYSKVVKAIQNAPHDVLVLSGDIHYGRICNVEFPGRSNRLYEVVSSPMSNLSGVSSVAAAKADSSKRLKYFPAIDIEGVTKTKVSYGNPWAVSTEFRMRDLRYLRERTKEHFMSLQFNKKSSGEINVEVRAWRCRERQLSTGLPKEDWTNPIKLSLS